MVETHTWEAPRQVGIQKIIVKPYRLVVWGKRLLAVIISTECGTVKRRRSQLGFRGTCRSRSLCSHSSQASKDPPIKRSRNSHENNPSVPRTNSHSLYAECMRNPVSCPLKGPVVVVVVVIVRRAQRLSSSNDCWDDNDDDQDRDADAEPDAHLHVLDGCQY